MFLRLQTESESLMAWEWASALHIKIIRAKLCGSISLEKNEGKKKDKLKTSDPLNILSVCYCKEILTYVMN